MRAGAGCQRRHCGGAVGRPAGRCGGHAGGPDGGDPCRSDEDAAPWQPSFEIYDSLVNRATKLLRTYTMQVEALKRYRSAGEQRVVVQHVNVTAEQAAVQVNGTPPALRGEGAASKTEERSHEQQLAHASEPAMRCP